MNRFGKKKKKIYSFQLYVPLNIFVALVDVVVWTERNEIELSTDADETLKKFLAYRRRVLSRNHPNDNAQLLTETKFDDGVNGKRSEIKNQTFN